MMDLIVSWISTAIAKAFEEFAELISGVFSYDITTFNSVFLFAGTAYNLLTKIGLAIALMITAWQFINFFFRGIDKVQDTPVRIVVNGVLAVGFIYYGNYLLELILEFCKYPYEELNSMEAVTGQVGVSWGNAVSAGVSAALPGVSALLYLILLLLIVFSMVKLIIEIVERYVVTFTLVYLSPLAACTVASSATSGIYKKFVSMFMSQCILIFLNAWCLKMAVSAMALGFHHPTAPRPPAVISFLMCYAFLRVAARMDSYLNQIGLNAAITGAGLGAEIAGGAAALMGTGAGGGGGGGNGAGGGLGGKILGAAQGAKTWSNRIDPLGAAMNMGGKYVAGAAKGASESFRSGKSFKETFNVDKKKGEVGSAWKSAAENARNSDNMFTTPTMNMAGSGIASAAKGASEALRSGQGLKGAWEGAKSGFKEGADVGAKSNAATELRNALGAESTGSGDAGTPKLEPATAGKPGGDIAPAMDRKEQASSGGGGGGASSSQVFDSSTDGDKSSAPIDNAPVASLAPTGESPTQGKDTESTARDQIPASDIKTMPAGNDGETNTETNDAPDVAPAADAISAGSHDSGTNTEPTSPEEAVQGEVGKAATTAAVVAAASGDAEPAVVATPNNTDTKKPATTTSESSTPANAEPAAEDKGKTEATGEAKADAEAKSDDKYAKHIKMWSQNQHLAQDSFKHAKKNDLNVKDPGTVAAISQGLGADKISPEAANIIQSGYSMEGVQKAEFKLDKTGIHATVDDNSGYRHKMNIYDQSQYDKLSQQQREAEGLQKFRAADGTRYYVGTTKAKIEGPPTVGKDGLQQSQVLSHNTDGTTTKKVSKTINQEEYDNLSDEEKQGYHETRSNGKKTFTKDEFVRTNKKGEVVETSDKAPSVPVGPGGVKTTVGLGRNPDGTFTTLRQETITPEEYNKLDDKQKAYYGRSESNGQVTYTSTEIVKKNNKGEVTQVSWRRPDSSNQDGEKQPPAEARNDAKADTNPPPYSLDPHNEYWSDLLNSRLPENHEKLSPSEKHAAYDKAHQKVVEEEALLQRHLPTLIQQNSEDNALSLNPDSAYWSELYTSNLPAGYDAMNDHQKRIAQIGANERVDIQQHLLQKHLPTLVKRNEQTTPEDTQQ